MAGFNFLKNDLCYVYYDINNEILLFVQNIINDSFLSNVVAQTNEDALHSDIMTQKIQEYKEEQNEVFNVNNKFNAESGKYIIGFERYFVTHQ